MTDDESIMHALIPQYGLHVYEWTWTSPVVCKVETDMGRKIVQLWEDASKVIMRGQIMDQLAHYRFRRIPRYIRSRYGDAFVQIGDRICTLSDDLADQRISYNEADVLAATRNLGRLHRAMESLRLPEQIELPKQQSASEHMQNALTALFEARNRFESLPQTPFSELYLTTFDDVFDRASRAATGSKNAGALDREKAAQETRQVAYGGYDLSEVARTNLGTIATIGFNRLGFGDREFDLYTHLRHLHKQGLTTLMPQVLREYEDIAGVAEQREERAAAFAAFPFEIADLAKEYFRAPDPLHDRWRKALTQELTRL